MPVIFFAEWKPNLRRAAFRNLALQAIKVANQTRRRAIPIFRIFTQQLERNRLKHRRNVRDDFRRPRRSRRDVLVHENRGIGILKGKLSRQGFVQ